MSGLDVTHEALRALRAELKGKTITEGAGIRTTCFASITTCRGRRRGRRDGVDGREIVAPQPHFSPLSVQAFCRTTAR
jgi:hypothetical protein